MTAAFLMNDSEDQPRWYTMTIEYLVGPSDEIKAVSHQMSKEGLLSILTHDDLSILIPSSSIKCIKFDKRFTKVKEVHAKEIQESRKKFEDRKKENSEVRSEGRDDIPWN